MLVQDEDKQHNVLLDLVDHDASMVRQIIQYVQQHLLELVLMELLILNYVQ